MRIVNALRRPWLEDAAQASVCVIFFPTTRLMVPVMFVLMFYAAVGLGRIFRLKAEATS